MSTSATAATVPQVPRGGESFHVVLASASAKDEPERKPMTRGNETGAPATSESAKGSEQEDALADDLAVSADGAKVATGSDIVRANATPGATGSGAAITMASTTPVPAGGSMGQFGTIQATAFASVQHPMPASLRVDEIAASATAQDEATPTAASGTSRMPGKQDRSKTQGQAVQGVGVSVTVPIPAKDIVMSAFRLDGSTREQFSDAPPDQTKRSRDVSADVSSKEPDASKASLDAGTRSVAAAATAPNGSLDWSGGSSIQPQSQSFQVGLMIPVAGGVSATQDVISSGSTTMGMESAPQDIAVVTKGVDAASASGSSATGAADTASHSVTSVAQAQLSGQTDSSKPVVPMLKVAEGPNSSMLSNATQVVSHEVLATQHASSGTAEALRASARGQELAASAHVTGGEDASASGINAARVIQTMGQTEMHVGMHSNEFGNISIRTAISQQQMVAQISV
ncbi:MAG: hypothetical protein WB439_15770, partial [Acidobacteriaceae bacterium]